MSSELSFDKIQNTSGSTYHSIVQTKTVRTTMIGGTYNIFTFPASNFDNLPTSSTGVQILTTTFQPRFSNSKILVQTNNIPMHEFTNQVNQFRIFAHANTTLLGWDMSGFWNGNFSGSLASNLGGQFLYAVTDSWGTDNRTIRLGVDADANSSVSLYIHWSYGDSWVEPETILTITEFIQ